MRIAESTVALASTHQEFSYTYQESVTMEAAASRELPAAILTISGQAEGRTYVESMAEFKKQQKEEAAQRQKENEERSAKLMAEHLRKSGRTQKSDRMEISDEYKMKLEMLKKLFEMLRQGKALKNSDVKNLEQADTESENGILDLRSFTYRKQEESAASVSRSATVSIGTNASGTTWQKVTATSGFTSESESTTFASQGFVKTQDGRKLGFHVEVSMSRAFMSQIDSLETKNYIKTDPLMINLDTNIGSVSDQKFYFDLDSDGKEEKISFAGKGSGFLALDKNGDGTINDGSELFGTKSGDGFKDLAAFDEDKNGWIDENDSVFSRLKVWTKDEDGNDHLMNLKDADVGAIYLGNSETQFSFKDEEHRLNGELKKTGIYLRESNGAAGTLNHVDLAL